MDTTSLLIKTLKRLSEHHIDFVVVDSLALRLHGANPATIDFTISFALDLPNCSKLCALLNAHHATPTGFPPHTPFRLTPALLKSVTFWQLETDLCDIDLLPLPDGVDSYAGLRQRAEEKNMGDFSVFVASVADLIAMKRAANRTKDQLHLLELLALQRVLGETAFERE